MATVASLTVNDTGYIQLPAGSTAQRPGSPSTGMIRYNTDVNRLEQYNGSAWQPFPGCPHLYRDRQTLYPEVQEPSECPY